MSLDPGQIFTARYEIPNTRKVVPVALKKVPGIGAGPNCNRKEKEKKKERDGSERETRKRDILVIRNYSFP